MTEEEIKVHRGLMNFSKICLSVMIISLIWFFAAEDQNAVFIPCLAVFIVSTVLGMTTKAVADDMLEGHNDTIIAIMLYLLYKSHAILIFFGALLIWIVQYFKGNV